MKFRPLHDRVVIERIDAEAKTAGGIIIPDTAQEKPQQGKVIAAFPRGEGASIAAQRWKISPLRCIARGRRPLCWRPVGSKSVGAHAPPTVGDRACAGSGGRKKTPAEAGVFHRPKPKLTSAGLRPPACPSGP